MIHLSVVKKPGFLRWFLLVMAGLSLSVPAVDQDDGRLQELLYGEALFHAHQRDYLSAIARLQLLEEQGLAQPSSVDARLLLARMKLTYGLDVEAGFDFHAVLGEDVPEAVRNRAWYELAMRYSHKGYYQAAAEVLEHVQGEMPAGMMGEYQLLRATVWMALDQNRQAAEVLEHWEGAPVLAAYAHYNRGIALLRMGDHDRAIAALEHAVDLPAKGEEALALRDKAHLSLGYVFARMEQYEPARKQLEAVRPQGPFSNRALLALGWIAHKQGRRQSALVPWLELRGRSPTDPAVLETLLVVPALHRELDALPAASRDYETALTTYTGELDRLQEVRESVRNGKAVARLLRATTGSGQGATGETGSDDTRYFGPLLASRDFQETRQGHDELQSMLQQVDEGLRNIDRLAQATVPAGGAPARAAGSPPSPARVAPGTASGDGTPAPQGAGPARPGDDPQWQQQWGYRQGPSTDYPPAGIPPLPEIESPADRVLKPLPESEFIGLPESDFSGLPAEPELIALPDSEAIGLPESEVIWLPESGRFHMPGEEDYAYPDRVPGHRTQAGERHAYPLNRILPSSGGDAGFDPGAVPVGQALRELAMALASATERMSRLGDSWVPGAGVAGLEERIAALRARILQLRARIEHAIALYEGYTRSLALDELDRRQHLLESLLEQARLELAKTYDQASDR